MMLKEGGVGGGDGEVTCQPASQSANIAERQKEEIY